METGIIPENPGRNRRLMMAVPPELSPGLPGNRNSGTELLASPRMRNRLAVVGRGIMQAEVRLA